MIPDAIKKLRFSKKYSLSEEIGKIESDQYDQGENPPLSQSDIEKIRAHKIHNGSTARCSICGEPLQNKCAACDTCGSSFNCGAV